MKVGDLYVFNSTDVLDDHFSNFKYGEIYKIKSFEDLPDSDSYPTSSNVAIIFENCKYGCILYYFDKYFVPLNDFRDIKLFQLLES